MVLTRERPRAATIERPPAYSLIDCDVHQSIKDYRDLQQFMPQAWRRYVGARGFGGPSSGYLTSVGLYRKDVAPPNGGEPGTDPAWLRHQLMERYNVSSTVRASFAVYNTMEEVDRVLAGMSGTHQLMARLLYGTGICRWLQSYIVT